MAIRKSITRCLRSSRTLLFALAALLMLASLSLITTPSAVEGSRDHTVRQRFAQSGITLKLPTAESSYAVADLVAPKAQAAGLTFEEAQEMCVNLWMKDWLRSCLILECDGGETACTSEEFDSCSTRAFSLYKSCMKSAGFAIRSSPGGT